MAADIRRDIPSFPIRPEELQQAYPVHDFQSFVKWWTYINPIEGQLRHFYPILGRHIERLRAQRVPYSEVMIAAGELPHAGVEAVETVQALREWTSGQERGDIQVEFLIAFGRNRSVEQAQQIANRILALFREGLIVGVALAGPEVGYPVKPFHSIFAQFHEAGLGIEIHAGEWCGPESVWEALTYGYPDRIGHGVSIFQDERLIDSVRERQIHIEFCPTSNLKTGSIQHLHEHPVRRAQELGLSFSINTDDPGPFECSLESEYELLSQLFGFEEDEFESIFANAWKARFQPSAPVPTVELTSERL
jgi:adenosine deaminase